MSNLECPKCGHIMRTTLLPSHVVICDRCGFWDSSLLYFVMEKKEAI